jgi:hypothetical protein
MNERKQLIKDLTDVELLTELIERLEEGWEAKEKLEKIMSTLSWEEFGKKEALLRKPLAEFNDLSPQIKGSLLKSGAQGGPLIRNFGDVVKRSYKDLRYLYGIGIKRANEIKAWVEKYGYQLSKTDHDY